MMISPLEDRRANAKYFRNVIFGIEDSLVSTVGLLSGLAIADTQIETLLLAGFILIFVEAFSMGVGSLLSEHSASEYVLQKTTPLFQSLKSGSIMFISYFITGFIPLAPYLLFSFQNAFWFSILFSCISLFIVGFTSARIIGIRAMKSGIELLTVGGGAVVIGAVIGRLVSAIV